MTCVGVSCCSHVSHGPRRTSQPHPFLLSSSLRFNCHLNHSFLLTSSLTWSPSSQDHLDTIFVSFSGQVASQDQRKESAAIFSRQAGLLAAQPPPALTMAHRLDPFAKSPRISSSQQQSTSWMDLNTDMDTDSPNGQAKRRKSTDSSPERRTLRHFDALAINVKTKVEQRFRDVLDGKGPTEPELFKAWVTDIVRSGLNDVRALSQHIRSQNDLTNELVNSLHRENRLLNEQNKLLKSSLSIAQSHGSNSNQPTYAAAVSGSTTTAAFKGHTFAAKVQQKSTTVRIADKNAAETAKVIKEKIKCLQKDVRATVTVVGQNVRVACDQQDSLDRIKAVIKDDRTLVTDRVMLKPQVKVVGIEHYDASEFLNAINEYNDDILGSSSSIATTIKNSRDKDKVDVILQTTGDIQRRLLQKGSLLHGFTNHRVYEHLQLRQCLRCLGLGLKKEQCKSCEKCLSSACRGSCTKTITHICFKCGGDHLRANCTAPSAKCAVCLNHGRNINGKHTKDHANHVMLGRECPLRIQGEIALKNRTDYG